MVQIMTHLDIHMVQIVTLLNVHMVQIVTHLDISAYVPHMCGHITAMQLCWRSPGCVLKVI